MAPVSTIKGVFFLATTLSTLSSELVFRTRAGGWNPGPVIGTTLVELGWGSGEKWGSPQMCQGVPVGIPLSRSGRSGGAEGRNLRLVEEEEPFCLGGKVQRRNGGPAPKGPKCLGIGDLGPLAIPFEEVGEILENVKVKCADLRPAVLIV